MTTHYTTVIAMSVKARGAEKLYDTIEYDAQLTINVPDIDDLHKVTKHLQAELDKIASNHSGVVFGDQST